MIASPEQRAHPPMSDFCCILQLQAWHEKYDEVYSPECVEEAFSEVQLLRGICNGGDALVPLLPYAALISSS
jgi:hypothetical protein